MPDDHASPDLADANPPAGAWSPAQVVYAAFLREVIIPYAFGDAERARGSGELEATRRAEIARGQRVEARAPLLATMSGKGGWHPDPEKAARYARFTNVSLLDHLCSVVRGAVQLAAIDLAAGRNPPPEGELRRRLATVAAIAFLHDADKMLGHGRDVRLDAAAVAGLMRRYGVDGFLDKHGHALTAAEMLVLIDGAELGRAGRLDPVPRTALHDSTYVRLADRLDGKFLQTVPDKPGAPVGADAVLEELRRYDPLDTDAVRDWRVLRVRDPHTPFLLDSLQAALSEACQARHGLPPLIETHHDGVLLVLIPQDGSDAVIADALANVTGTLGAAIRVATTNRGTVDLLDAPGDVAALRRSIAAMLPGDREKVLRVGADALRLHRADMDALLLPVGAPPQPPDLARFPGRLVPLWTGTATMEGHRRALHADAVLVNAALSCDDPSAKLGIPGAGRREAELRAVLTEAGLLTAAASWLDAVPDDTRRTLLAALAAGGAARDDDLADQVTGPDGLVALWLEGRDGRPGLASKIDASGARLATAVAAHYRALLAGDLVAAEDEDAEGRCHFTNAPVPRTTRIEGKTGLYGVNVSAFSGREGRPESYKSSKSETLVSPVAEAEHRLRTDYFEVGDRSAKRRESPVRVTSPTSAGLFGALSYSKSNDASEYAFSDLTRVRVEGKLTYSDETGLERRVRVARYEEWPARLATTKKEIGQIALVRMAAEAALRLGRPIHLFRGLPQQRPEFVFFDTLPQPIESLLNGKGVRLERLYASIVKLRGIEKICDTVGFGVKIALAICDSATRFGAACDALARAERHMGNKKKSNPELRGILLFAESLLGEHRKMATKTDEAILGFGKAMASVQRAPSRDGSDNINELGLRVALDTVDVLMRMGQSSHESLVAGIAGEVQKTLTRRNLIISRKKTSMDAAVETAAKMFVDEVWHGAFKSTLPSSQSRRVALAVYRFSFTREAWKLRAILNSVTQNDVEDY